MIKLQNLTKREGKKTILNDLNTEIKKGETVGILGKNSTGKTLLLDMIIGLKKPNTGKIFIEDKDIFEDIFETRRKISYMSESPLYKDMTVKEYLKFLSKIRNEAELKNILEEQIKVFSLEDIEDHLIGNLSKSENKKLAIAGAYIGSSEIILLDEPFIGLDIDDTEKILDFLKSKKDKFTTIIATHSAEHLEEICDRVIILNKGKIASDVEMKDLKTKKQNLKDLFIEVTKD